MSAMAVSVCLSSSRTPAGKVGALALLTGHDQAVLVVIHTKDTAPARSTALEAGHMSAPEPRFKTQNAIFFFPAHMSLAGAIDRVDVITSV